MVEAALDPAVVLTDAQPGQEGVGLDVMETRLSKLGHQELSRVLEELENLSSHLIEAAGPETWLMADSAQSLLCNSLGYEDVDEFEDAIQGDFESFLKALPHIETKIQEEEGSAKGKLVLRARPEPSMPRGCMKVLQVRTSKDLWRVLDIGKNASIEIPAIEFEIGADNKRSIDTIYNHIAKAIYNLGSHARMVPGLSEDTRTKIMETVMALNSMLDVEVPWTFIVKDETGLSVFYPETDVEKIFLDENALETPQEA